MHLRCEFVTDKKQIHVPEGWVIQHMSVADPPRGKPQFIVLMKKDDQTPKKKIGFRN